MFEAVVRTCLDAGLVKGEGFAVDASVMEADASRYHGKVPDEVDWSLPQRQTRAVKEYLAALDVDAQPDPDRKPPKVILPSDPCSAWTAKANIKGAARGPRASHRPFINSIGQKLPREVTRGAAAIPP